MCAQRRSCVPHMPAMETVLEKGRDFSSSQSDKEASFSITEVSRSSSRERRTSRDAPPNRNTRLSVSSDSETPHVSVVVVDENKLYGCPKCGKSFKHNYKLKRHVSIVHEKRKPHKCPHNGCNKSFSQRCHLKVHISSVHDKQKPHKCSKCDRSFSQNSHLKAHIISVHEKRKQHSCSHCEKSFSGKRDLDLHIASVHDKLKPHICVQCNKRFSRNFNLKIHIAEEHDKRKAHVCSKCKCRFATKGNLNAHIAKGHNEEISTGKIGECFTFHWIFRQCLLVPHHVFTQVLEHI